MVQCELARCRIAGRVSEVLCEPVLCCEVRVGAVQEGGAGRIGVVWCCAVQCVSVRTGAVLCGAGRCCAGRCCAVPRRSAVRVCAVLCVLLLWCAGRCCAVQELGAGRVGSVVRDGSVLCGIAGRSLTRCPRLRPPAAGGGDVTEPLASTTFH